MKRMSMGKLLFSMFLVGLLIGLAFDGWSHQSIGVHRAAQFGLVLLCIMGVVSWVRDRQAKRRSP